MILDCTKNMKTKSFIYKGSKFLSCGKLDVRLHQKYENKVLYSLGFKTFKFSETKKIKILAIKVKFYKRLLDRCFNRWKLIILFPRVKYTGRAKQLLPKILVWSHANRLSQNIPCTGPLLPWGTSTSTKVWEYQLPFSL